LEGLLLAGKASVSRDGTTMATVGPAVMVGEMSFVATPWSRRRPR
jgi:membrane-anchored protein YejM (alkaline phosphatase superfamily)